MLGMGREAAESSVAHALSRHVGYTSGAFDLNRIFGVLDFFSDRPSAYLEEIVGDLITRQGDKASHSYLSDVISFSSSFGLVSAVSGRESKLSRYAATELGRSVLGCNSLSDAGFANFFRTYIVMSADADFLVPLMQHIAEGNPEPIIECFCRFTKDLRETRYRWLIESVPQPVLLERIASRIAWLKKGGRSRTPYAIDLPTMNTARHHVRPRLGWLADLGLADPKKAVLTHFGDDILRSIMPGLGSYFWIAPEKTVMETLALVHPSHSAREDDLGIGKNSKLPDTEEMDSLVSDVSAVMKIAFERSRLVHADQASLRLPIAYIQYRAYKDARAYQWGQILDLTFTRERVGLRRLSAHKGQIGFYKVIKS